jgi:hypothetical protein
MVALFGSPVTNNHAENRLERKAHEMQIGSIFLIARVRQSLAAGQLMPTARSCRSSVLQVLFASWSSARKVA